MRKKKGMKQAMMEEIIKVNNVRKEGGEKIADCLTDFLFIV